MSTSNNHFNSKRPTTPTAPEISKSEQRREDTLNRIRSALVEERLAVVSTSEENTGTDPYNSGIHRALATREVWSKRSR